MKRLIKISAIIAAAAAYLAAAANPDSPQAPEKVSSGRAPYATEIRVCASLAESGAAGFPESKYIRPITEWLHNDGTLKSHFAVPFAWINRQVVLHVEWATSGYTIEIDGKEVVSTRSGMVPSDFVITRAVKEGRNEIRIRPYADASEGVLSPAAGGEFRTGRIYVQSPAPVRVRDIVTRTTMSADGGASAEIGIVMKSEMLNPKDMRIHYELLVNDTVRLHHGIRELTLDMRKEDTVRFAVRVPDSCLWTLRNPRLLRLDVRTQNNGRYLENETFRFGLSQVRVTDNGLVEINGTPTGLIMADVEPDATAEQIAELREEGYNTVHPRVGIVDRSLYDICDSIGMYVVAQIPVSTAKWGESRRVGGNPSNDDSWIASYVDRAEGVYHALKLHPSVVAFSIADDSANGICLYETYLRMKSFGDSRPMVYDSAAGEWNSDPLRRFSSPAEAGLTPRMYEIHEELQ